MVDPNLLHFVQLLTQSVRSKRRRLFQSESEVSNTKLIRQLFLICSLLFTTNDQCSMPQHTILTEAILCHGGSLELVTIFNRVGAAASLDTAQCVATHVVQTRLTTGIQPELAEGALSIVN